MKRLSIALAAAFALGSAAPAMAADYIPAPAPLTCMEAVNAHYATSDPHAAILLSPLWASHALLCHVFHHDGYYYAPVRG